MNIPICTQCNKFFAISPEGLCNICDENALSKRMKHEANQEDNDLAYLGKMRKVRRQEKVEVFALWLELLLKADNTISVIEHDIQGKFEIKTTNYGVVDYYPKADKVLIRRENKWNTKGLNWLKKHIIKQII